MMDGPNPRCPDCQVGIGVPHLDGCDIARCIETGLQRFGCDEDHDCGDDRWSGFWPGITDCNWHGWFITADSDFGRRFPESVGTEDLNLHAKACAGLIAGYRWDRDRRHVIRA